MRADGLPVLFGTMTPMCPYCHMGLGMKKGFRGGYVWGHPEWQEHWEEEGIWVCPNNAALFFQSELGAALERMEPIV